jgi:TonB family protein
LLSYNALELNDGSKLPLPSRAAIGFCLILTSLLMAGPDPATGQKQEPPAGPSSAKQPPSGESSPSLSSFTPEPIQSVPLRKVCGVNKTPDCITAPRAVFTPDPEYSKEARDAHLQGTCVLWLVVGTDGTVHNIKVVRALGLGLDEKAAEAVRRWVFQPALKDEKAVAVQINVEVSFRLGSIVISPVSLQIFAGAKQQFTAKVIDGPKSSIKWSVGGPDCAGSSCGRISADGLYAAPESIGRPTTVTVTATSATDPNTIGWSNVTLQPTSPP